MRLLYNAGIRATSAAIGLASLMNDKARLWHKGRQGLLEKMEQTIDPEAPVAWFHAASLGEFEQGRPVIEAFRVEHPQWKILLTFYSPSGYEVRKNFTGADYIFYLPADTPRNVRRFMQIVRPRVAVFIKYEFWLNYLAAMRQQGTKLYLISAIFRPTQVFFKWYGGPFRQALRAFTHLFVQDDASKQILEGIGIRAVDIAGDTRFDRVSAIATHARTLPEVARFADSGPVLVAGSTWPPDEELLLTLIERYADVKFIIAPHEIEPARIERLRGRITRPTLRYTELTPESDLEGAGVLFIDTIGILSSVYRYGRWSYIGGGFGVGIHNTLEAATFGLPLAFGPNYQRFREACELVALGAARSVADEAALQAWFGPLHDDPQQTARCGALSSQYVKQHCGATARIIAEICRK